MDITLQNLKPHTYYDAIPSKSIYIRALILSSFGKKDRTIFGYPLSEDIKVTIDALNALGANIKEYPGYVKVSPIKNLNMYDEINCKDSATLYRFLREIVPDAKLTGSNRLLERVKSNITSQTISGKMLRAYIYDEPYNYSEAIVSKSYVELTKSVIEDFKMDFDKYSVEGDYTNGAIFLVLGLLTDSVTVGNLNLKSVQGDRNIVDIIKRFGGKVAFGLNDITTFKSDLKGIDIDGSLNPDLVPILSVLGSYAKGTTRIYNIGYLKDKESDRINSTYQMIKNLGGEIDKGDDSLIIRYSPLKGGTISSFNDHRIVMAGSIASFLCDSPVNIKDIDCISKSYPNFFDILGE